ncbi:MAG TPA: hypothetical protein PLP17_16940, partial [Oligoflexia bacterium]|nr:hypothetical protein [Oligoflexia bacterium]
MNNTTRICRSASTALLIFAASALSSCSAVDWVSSLFSREHKTQEAPDEQPAAAGQGVSGGQDSMPAAEPGSTAAQTPNDTVPAQPSVELLWQVPGEAVEKYYIFYGSDAQNLAQRAEVPVSQLEKIDHPVHGPLYRYVL